MRLPFARFRFACLLAAAVIGGQLPLRAQTDPLGDWIEQTTKPNSAAVAPSPVGSVSDPAAKSQTAGTPSSGPVATPVPSSNAWGNAGIVGAASEVLSGAGVDAATWSSLGLPSLFGSSAANVAGVLQYCVQNNYLTGAKEQADAFKNGLLTMAGLQSNPAAQASNANYASGLAGLLMGGEGERFDLNSMQATVKEKACSYVLQQAPSLL